MRQLIVFKKNGEQVIIPNVPMSQALEELYRQFDEEPYIGAIIEREEPSEKPDKTFEKIFNGKE